MYCESIKPFEFEFENFMMIQWGEHNEKGVMVRRTDGRTDGMNLFTELLVVEAKKCQVKSGHSCGHQTFVLLCSLSFMISRRSRVGLFDFRVLYRILLTTFQMCFIRRLIQALAFDSMQSVNSIIFILCYTLHLDICNGLPTPMTIQSGTLQIIWSVVCRLIAN